MTPRGGWAAASVVLAIRPAGRLLIRFEANGDHDARGGGRRRNRHPHGGPHEARERGGEAGAVHRLDQHEQSADQGQHGPRDASQQVCRRLPATDQDDGRGRHAQQKVGRPSGRSNAETANSAAAVRPMPASAVRPPVESRGSSDSAYRASRRLARTATRSTTKVAAIDSAEARAKLASHRPSGGSGRHRAPGWRGWRSAARNSPHWRRRRR